jgi:hypothetical protein
MQMLSVFELASWAAHKNKRAEMVSCEIVREKHVVPVLLTMSSTNPIQIGLTLTATGWAFSKSAATSGSSVQLPRPGSLKTNP